MATVTINRTPLIGGVPPRPLGWHYEATGPDGREFTNTRIATLRDILKRRYGRDVGITKAWES